MQTSERIFRWLFEELTPSEIAKQCELSLAFVVKEVHAAVLEGRLLRSQVQSTLNQEWLMTIESLAQYRPKYSPESMLARLKACCPDCQLNVDELKFYLVYSGRSFRAGETYELLSEIERTLHGQIRLVLREWILSGGIRNEKKLLEGREATKIDWFREAAETSWWRKGVPKEVRLACVRAREEDAQLVPEHPYCYTTLTHLKQIIFQDKGRGWHLFKDRLPKSVADHKDVFEEDLDRLIAIRNRVMHPVRGAPPSEKDLGFVKHMHEALHISMWRKKESKKL
jgi:hypothetical protein